MRIWIFWLAVFLSLSGCSVQHENAGPARSASETDHTKARGKNLAYKHSITIDTDEAGAKALYDKLLNACVSDTANSCTLLDTSFNSGRHVRAQIQLRVHPNGVKPLVMLAASGGPISGEATEVVDLSGPIVDSAKRIEMLQQYQKRLQALELKASQDVDALIKTSKELATVQAELEQAAGENQALLQRVQTDILTINISTDTRRGFWKPIGDSLSEFRVNLSNGVATAITAVAYVLPWMLTFLMIGWPLRWLWRRRKLRRDNAV